jgi:hypothetical protein
MNGRQPAQLVRLRSELSDRDLAILLTVSELRFVTGQQLQAVHFDSQHSTASSAVRTARRVLTRLTGLHVLRRLERRVGGVRAGSDGFVYCCGPQGFRLLGAAKRACSGYREPSAAFLGHTLAVAELLTQIVAASSRGEFQLVRYQVEPACWRSLERYGQTQTLRRDLWLVLASGDREWHFLEIYLGTEHGPHLRAKSQQYLDYWGLRA